MKKREKKILDFIKNREDVSINDLMTAFEISRRTVYYDIENINREISNVGKVINLNRTLSYVEYNDENEITKANNDFLDRDNRKYFLLYLILVRRYTTIDNLAEVLDVSKNTVVSSIKDVKEYLNENNLCLEFDKTYFVKGDELKIRDLFIFVSQYNFDNRILINDEVRSFNEKYSLEMSDYSLNSLSRLINFLELRWSFGKYLDYYEYKDEVGSIKEIKELVNTDNIYELVYLKSFLMTLSNVSLDDEENEELDNYLESVVDRFEQITDIKITDRITFILNLKRHFIASYYRIKFNFSIYNPLKDEIYYRYADLFKIIKTIFQNNVMSIDFSKARDDEIAYIVAYFGGYINSMKTRMNNVVIVCPNGLVISKTLQLQLEKYIPNINIVSVMSIYEFEKSNIKYDYCISTVKLDNVNNLIVVNPLLSDKDIRYINQLISMTDSIDKNITIGRLLYIIKKYSQITDEKALVKELEEILNIKKEEDNRPLLTELLTLDKINRVKHVKDYKEAISLAAKPLLEQGYIEQAYIEEMYKALEKFGPYIVLADHFALPHATSKVGVNKIGMSLLVVEDEVDLLGKPVNIFCCLAAVDNNSHLKALASLAEILYDKENIDKIIKGSKEEILSLLRGEN